MLRHNFLILLIMLNIPLLGMYQSPIYNQQQPLIVIPNKPKYKKLEDKFGIQRLTTVLHNYQYNKYGCDDCFNKWSSVADSIIGHQYVEEQRRYFLVNIMLHAQQNMDGLNVLHDSFFNKHSSHTYSSFNTPQGPVHTQLFPWQYKQAMKVCNDIRTQLFTGGNINPLILVQRSPDEMAPEVKWSLFKGAAIISYLISLCLKKEDEKEDKKKQCDHSGHSLFSLLALSDILQKVEEDTQKIVEKHFPILKEYEVKSLIDDKSSWLYDRKNWIFCGSVGCMVLLLLCIFRDKIPHLQRTFAFVVVT